ncbi:MAG: MlaD family protein [Candidatus Omnitrophota bacterium]
MFRDEKLELRVGLFMGLGIFLLFFIVFSIGDLGLGEKGYNITARFDYVNGLTKNSPVRLAGVQVGEVKDIEIYYDEKEGRTRVKLDAWIKNGTMIERDASARINSLGLLGEQYLEFTPGASREFLKPGDEITGRNPANIGQQIEKMSDFINVTSAIVDRLEQGDGTLGKLISDDRLYNDLSGVFNRLNRGEGTIGRLLVEEKIYNDLQGFTGDIKDNPWKLIYKTSDAKPRKADRDTASGSVGAGSGNFR